MNSRLNGSRAGRIPVNSPLQFGPALRATRIFSARPPSLPTCLPICTGAPPKLRQYVDRESPPFVANEELCPVTLYHRARYPFLASNIEFRYPASMEQQQQPEPEPEPATRELRNPVTGDLEDARVVDIVGTENRPILVSLSDGSRIRVTFDVFEAARFPSGTDSQGYPLYYLRWANSIVVVDGPSSEPNSD